MYFQQSMIIIIHIDKASQLLYFDSPSQPSLYSLCIQTNKNDARLLNLLSEFNEGRLIQQTSILLRTTHVLSVIIVSEKSLFSDLFPFGLISPGLFTGTNPSQKILKLLYLSEMKKEPVTCWRYFRQLVEKQESLCHPISISICSDTG